MEEANLNQITTTFKQKKKRFTFLWAPIFFVFAYLISACTWPQVLVKGINITDNEKTIAVGETYNLNVEFTPKDASNKFLTWMSNNETVATVEVGGQVTGQSVGQATITVLTDDGGYSDTCLIYVTGTPVNVTGITLNHASLTAYVGDSPQLIPTIQPANATNKNVAWTSSNTNVATIAEGIITTKSIGTTTLTATTVDGGFTASAIMTVQGEPSLTDITIDRTANFYYGNYSTNFGTDIYKTVTYGFYRVDEYTSNSGMMKLFPSDSQYDYGALPGSFYNDSPIRGIRQLTISYMSTSGLVVKYGDTRTRNYAYSVAPSTGNTWSTTTINLAITSAYFSLETTTQILYLKSVKVSYNNTLIPNTNSFETNDQRIAPAVYEGTLVDGQSTVSVADDITVIGNTYTINSYRTYTYYSFNYVKNNKNNLNLDSIAMTDPIDVANYYIAFHLIPANYGKDSRNQPFETAGTKSEVNSIFGSDARLITSYTRDDGYAESVPWRNEPGKSTPVYYEFDIGLDSSYSTSNRSIGRLVMWVYGWTCYDDEPVAVFTDDHYATFSEYLNYGTFGARFDAEPNTLGYRTGRTNLDGSTQLILA